MKTRTIVIEIEVDEEPTTVTVTYYPSGPGNISGPPDNWSPPEPLEVVKVVRFGTEEEIALTDTMYDAICYEVEDSISFTTNDYHNDDE